MLRGNLAPDGAVIKPSAATPAPDEAPRPRGRVRGHRRLQGADRRRGARHRRDLRHGAEELRPEGLSRHGRGRQHGAAAEGAEARASPTWCGSPTRACRGTAYGTVVLHTAPEAARRRPAGARARRRHDRARRGRRAGCISTFPTRSSRARLADWKPAVEAPERAMRRLYHDHVEGADTGADFDFLEGLPRRAGRPGLALMAWKIALVGIGKIARDQHVPAHRRQRRTSSWRRRVSRHGDRRRRGDFTDLDDLLEARPDMPLRLALHAAAGRATTMRARGAGGGAARDAGKAARRDAGRGA